MPQELGAGAGQAVKGVGAGPRACPVYFRVDTGVFTPTGGIVLSLQIDTPHPPCAFLLNPQESLDKPQASS